MLIMVTFGPARQLAQHDSAAVDHDGLAHNAPHRNFGVDFVTVHIPDSDKKYPLSSKGRTSPLILLLMTGSAPPTQSLRVDASLTKISNKYRLVVKGTTNVTQVKNLYLRIGKSKYSLIMNEKTQKLSLSKRISIKGNPPETGKLEISCADGTYYYLNIPIQLASTK